MKVRIYINADSVEPILCATHDNGVVTTHIPEADIEAAIEKNKENIRRALRYDAM
jgi:hypothetical protein